MTAEICDFSTHIFPPVTIVTEHKTQFFTHFSKKNKQNYLLIISKGYLWHIIWIFSCGIKRVKYRHKYHECEERAHVNIITCTVCCRTDSWCNQLIDIIIAWTGFDFNGVRSVITAVIDSMTADISSDDSILNCWVSTMNPQWNISATAVLSNTCVRDLSVQAMNNKTIPASPGDRLVTTSDWSICIIDGSPWIVQYSVVVAGVWQEIDLRNITCQYKRINKIQCLSANLGHKFWILHLTYFTICQTNFTNCQICLNHHEFVCVYYEWFLRSSLAESILFCS